MRLLLLWLTSVAAMEPQGGVNIQTEIGVPEEHFTREDVSCSFMLMGMFVFTMVIFYLVNYPDDDIKRYSWQNISTTISIFCAILIFSAVDEVLLRYMITPLLGEFPRGWRAVVRVVAGYVIFLLWLLAAELMIAHFAKVLCADPAASKKQWVVCDTIRADHGIPVDETSVVLHGTKEKSVARIGTLEVFVAVQDLEIEAAEQRTKCWSMLYAHMAGFAMISAGGDLQHSELFSSHWSLCLLSVVFDVLFLLLVFRISAWIRPEELESDDEEVASDAVELWNYHAIEAEDELFCLSISFLLVQALRFQVTGVLATKSGGEPGKSFGTEEILVVYGEAALFVMATVATVFTGKKGRLSDLLRGTLSMSFAWSLLFASRWMFESWPLLVKWHISPFSIEGRLILTLFLSAFACLVIIVLDQIEDAAEQDERIVTHKIVKNIVTGLSILVGFTWETTMDGCTEAVFSTVHGDENMRAVSKLLGGVCILLVVLPAWRRYVLHTVFRLMKHKKDRRAALKLAEKLQRMPHLHKASTLGVELEWSSDEEERADPDLTC